VSEGLEYGMVGVNTGLMSTEVAPFGGFKESGIVGRDPTMVSTSTSRRRTWPSAGSEGRTGRAANRVGSGVLVKRDRDGGGTFGP
jgi:hypothetical protein